MKAGSKQWHGEGGEEGLKEELEEGEESVCGTLGASTRWYHGQLLAQQDGGTEAQQDGGAEAQQDGGTEVGFLLGKTVVHGQDFSRAKWGA